MPLKFKSFFELGCTDNSIIWRTRRQPPPHPFFIPHSDFLAIRCGTRETLWRIWCCLTLIYPITRLQLDEAAGQDSEVSSWFHKEHKKRSKDSLFLLFALNWTAAPVMHTSKECQSNPHSGSLLIWQRLTYVGLGIPPLWHL